MKIGLSELRQIVKTIIKEEMTQTPLDILANMNPKPKIQKGVSGATELISFGNDKIKIDSKGQIFFGQGVDMKKITELLKKNGVIRQISGDTFIAKMVKLDNPNGIKAALEEFFKQNTL